MKKLLSRIVLFLVILVIIIVGILTLCVMFPSVDNLIGTVTCSEGFDGYEEKTKTEAIEKTQNKNDGYTKLFVDDSVCASMFGRLQDKNSVYLFAGTNRAFLVAGQYVQIREFLKTHDNVSEVYMFLSKGTWESTIDVQYGYQCFAVPIISTNTFDDLENNTKQEMKDTYSGTLIQPWFVYIYNKSCVIRKLTLNLLNTYHEKVLKEDMSVNYVHEENKVSDVNQQYLDLIINMCEKNNIALHILHDPIADTPDNRDDYDNEIKMINEISNDKNKKYLDEYLNSVLFYPEDLFIDGVHFKGDDALNNQIIHDIQGKTNLLYDVVVTENN